MGQARRRREEQRAAEPARDPNGAGRVVLAYVHGAQVCASFHETIVQLLIHDMAHDGRIVGGGGKVSQYSSANVSNARNNVVRRFLRESTAEWLFFIDTDMSFPADTLDLMLAEAYRHEAPIVGGLCFGQADGQLFPTMYRLGGDGDVPKMFRMNVWPRTPDENSMHPLVEVSATGAAVLLVHRTVFEEIAQRWPEPYPWFAETILGEPPWGGGAPGTGSAMGEDITFCLRALQAGFRVFVHVGVEVGHEKSWILTREQYDDQRAALLAAETEA